MGNYSDEFQPSFIIALGDNFYSNGVSSSTDSYWDYLWVNVYLDYYPSLRISWYPVFGE
jgi:tartrate-resistant acid phosphatase type 5